MRLIFFILLLPFVAFGKNYKAVDTSLENKTYYKMSLCKKEAKDLPNYKGCFEVNEEVLPETHVVADVDDLSRPIYRSVENSPVQIACEDMDDCIEKIDGACDADPDSTAKVTANESWLAYFGLSSPMMIYCQKILSYEQVKKLVFDAAKKAAYDAKILAEKTQVALEISGGDALQVGRRIKATMVGMIRVKDLPKAQRKQLRGDLKSIIEALDVGSIDIAIDEIKALTEDGSVVTPEAKSLILKIAGDAGYSIE